MCFVSLVEKPVFVPDGLRSPVETEKLVKEEKLFNFWHFYSEDGSSANWYRGIRTFGYLKWLYVSFKKYIYFLSSSVRRMRNGLSELLRHFFDILIFRFF